MITKRLVYHFYVGNDFETNAIYKIHQYLLKKYNNIFDEALFIISIDDIENKDRIKLAKKFLLECDFKNIEFRVEENDSLYEVATFDKYILKRLNTLDGMTFFAHTKGTNDINEKDKEKDAVYAWIFSLYYLSLEFYKEGEKAMFGTTEDSCFFGGLLGLFKEDESHRPYNFPKNNAMYIGTYYWLNCKQIYSTHKDEIPTIYNRFYAENFPGSICHPYNYELYSHNYMMINGNLLVNNPIFSTFNVFKRYISCLLNEEEMNVFFDNFNKMKEDLNL